MGYELPSYEYHPSQFRKFSSEKKVFSLSKVIESELKGENEDEYCRMPEILSKLHADISKCWSIIVDESSNSSAIVKLLRKNTMTGGGKVSIYFHCQDTIDYDDS